MDVGFYGFTNHPFAEKPTPTSVFLSEGHRQLLHTLHTGVTARQGFLVLVGNTGLGKTTLLQSYLARLNRQQYTILPLSAAALPLQEILAKLCQAFDTPYDTENLHILADRLRRRFLEEYTHRRQILLVIDDAHLLAVQALWNLRMLSDLMHTPTGYLLQIVLVGRPAFNDTLRRPELQQLEQRLSRPLCLTPLSPSESLAYIHHHLAQVTPQAVTVFTAAALACIVKYADGNPQRLNTLCTSILTLGAVYQQRPIPRQTARKVVARCVPRVATRYPYAGLVCTAGLVLGLGLLWIGLPNLTRHCQRLLHSTQTALADALARTTGHVLSEQETALQPFSQPTASGTTVRAPFSALPPEPPEAAPASKALDFRHLLSTNPSPTRGEYAPLSLVARHAYPPFTDAALPQQGMLTEIVRTAFAAIGYQVTLEFRDWKSGLPATESYAFTGMFPYASTQGRSELFLYSKPLYRSAVRAFIRAGDPLALSTPAALGGKNVCWPKSLSPHADPAFFVTPDTTLHTPQTLETCFSMLLQAAVDVAVADVLQGHVVLHAMGAADTIRVLDYELGSPTLHLILPRFASQSHTLVYEFDQSLTLLEKRGILHEITTRHLQQYAAFLMHATPRPPLEQTERRP